MCTPKTPTYQQAEVAVMPAVNGDCMRLRALWTASLGRVSDDRIPSGPRQYRAVCAAGGRGHSHQAISKRWSHRCKLQAPGAKGRVPCMPRRLGAVFVARSVVVEDGS